MEEGMGLSCPFQRLEAVAAGDSFRGRIFQPPQKSAHEMDYTLLPVPSDTCITYIVLSSECGNMGEVEIIHSKHSTLVMLSGGQKVGKADLGL